MEPAEQMDSFVEASPPPPLPLANGQATAGVLDRDSFVKRRQAEREAAAKAAPESIGEGIEGRDDLTLVAEAETAGPEAPGVEAADAAAQGAAAQGAETLGAETLGAPGGEIAEAREPDLGPFEFDREPAAPPLEMTDAEREALEHLPPELHGYVERLHSSAATRAQEGRDRLALARQDVETRREALDRALAEAIAVTQSKTQELPHSPRDLQQLAEEQGFEAWQRAVTENETARTEALARHDQMAADVKTRQTEILTKFAADLPRLIPAWREPSVRQQEARELGTYLRESGFNEAELRSVADARLVALARKAMRYDAALARRNDGLPGTSAETGLALSRRNTGQPGPTNARPPRSNGNAQIDAAAQRYRETPTADTFAQLRELRRQTATNSNRWRV